MITPTEIKEQCLKWWNAVLIAVFNGQDFFPKEISRIGKVQTKDILDNILDYRQAIDQLKKQSI